MKGEERKMARKDGRQKGTRMYYECVDERVDRGKLGPKG